MYYVYVHSIRCRYVEVVSTALLREAINLDQYFARKRHRRFCCRQLVDYAVEINS